MANAIINTNISLTYTNVYNVHVLYCIMRPYTNIVYMHEYNSQHDECVV